MGITRKEAEDLKPLINEAAVKVLGFSDNAVVIAAVNCLSSNLDKKSTVEHLKPLMDKSATKFVDTMFNNIANAKKSRKRKDVIEETVESKKPRRFVEPEVPNKEPATESPGALTTQQIKMMMDKARQQIEQRKVQLKSMSPTVLSAKVKEAEATTVLQNFNGNDPSQMLLNTASDKAKKAAELQQRIQARLATKPDLLPALAAGVQAKLFDLPDVKTTEKEKSAPTPLILDEMGRSVDSSGHVLELPSRVPTLKANIRAKKREEFRQKLQEKPLPELTSGASNFFDSRVKQEAPTRSRRSFKFHDKGRFVQIAQKIRTKSQLEKLQSEIAQAAKRTGIQQASKLALIAPKVSAESVADAIPQWEWWDDYIVVKNGDNDDNILVNDVVTNLIEHPTQIAAPGNSKMNEPVLGTFLTKKERKKLRRMNRREALKDEQEKVRLGLIPAPEPKVKLSNLMRVLGTDAVQDPTKVEKHVRMQMAKRQRAHEQANAARKLTTEQKKDKRIKKLKEDTSDAVHIAMYRVWSLRDPAKKFKIEMNSKQLYMTGCTVLHPDINVVVVEGGPKAQRKFQRLMMIRIKWDEDKKGKRLLDAAVEEPAKLCELIWEGQSSNHNFGDMTFKQCANDDQAKEFFRNHGVEHYWDLAHSQKILED